MSIRATKPWVAGAAGLACAAVLLLAGRWLLFSTFMVYDDEGYILISLRNFLTAGPLYDAVYTQYGPFFYLVHKALPLLGGWEWTNTSARWITLFYWFGTALLAADAVRRLTASAVAGIFTLAGVFGYLWVMTHEPGHPGGMIGFMVAAAVWLGARRDPATDARTAGAIAALGAAMALTKINTGAFLLLALWTWLAVHTPAGPVRRVTLGLATIASAVGPVAVMNSLLDRGWVQQYAATVTLAVLTTTLVAWRWARPHEPTRTSWRAAVRSGAAVGGVTIAAILLAGSSASGVLHGVLLDPLRHPGVYSFAFVWRPGSLLLTLAAAGVVIAAIRKTEPGPRLVTTIALIRMAAAAAVGLAAVGWLPISLPAFGLSYGVPLAALCAYPLIDDHRARARAWIALVLVWQCLHAYPVTGSQLNWGTFLWVPLLALAVEESLRWQRQRTATPWPGRIVAGAAVAVAAVLSITLARTARTNFNSGDPLGLPGAEHIVVPSSTAIPIRIMAANAAHHADPLFSFTGAYSFNLWTGRPTPTLANATHWFTLLSDAQQAGIINALDAAPRAAVVVQLDTVRYLLEEKFPIDGPLANYLAQNFHRGLELDGYAFWVKQDREIDPIDVAHWTEAMRALQFVTTLDPATIATVEFWRFDGDLRALVDVVAASDLTLTTDSVTNEPALTRVDVRLASPVSPLALDGLLRLLDDDGNELGFVRVQP